LNFEQELLAGVFDAIAKIAGFIKVDVKFTIRDISKFEDQALEQAIAIAKSKSELIAQSTGLTLGKIRDIVYGQVQWFGERKIMSTETESRDRPVFLRARPVEVADVEINDDVTISWEVSG
ncbi:MAG: SIMPL domain-containing protein, partial [Chloroflexi bacterium]|nr:SIMPL domain-containing protein [Chloroflexota bacterium]